MKIDECKSTTLETLRKCAKQELAKQDVKNELKNLATEPVKQRRERIRRHPSDWERFACCTRYGCDVEWLEGGRNQHSFPTRHEMAIHLRTEHPEELDERLDRCRCLLEFLAGPW
jgi:hypothetical protein